VLKHRLADPLEIRLSPTSIILPNLVTLGQTVRTLLRRSTWKIWPIAYCHSRSSEPTQIDPLWLPINAP